MGYLFHILLAVGVQALGESGFEPLWRAPWGLLLLLVVPHALALQARRVALAGRFSRAAALAQLVQHSPPALHLAAVGAFGWVDTTRALTGTEAMLFPWPQPAFMLALAPFVAFELAAIDAFARVHGLRPVETSNVRAFQARMLLSGIAPLLAYVLAASAIAWNDALRANIDHVELWHAAFTATVVALVALILPSLLRNTLRTVPLPGGPHRSLLEAIATRAGFRCRELLVWRTGGLMANAAIIGLLPRHRVVLFSDSLLGSLTLRELAAVFAHEIGHAARHHVLVFLAWAVAFFMGADVLATWALGASDPATWTALFVVGGSFAVWLVGFGWLSRRCELEADLYSIELLGDPEGMVSALERVGGRLRDVAGWRHFSTADRVRFLWRAVGDPAFGGRFRRRLRRFARAGFALAVLALGLQVVQLVETYAQERVVVDLALGRYVAAKAKVATAAGIDAGLATMVREAGELERRLGAPAAEADLARAVTESLETREFERALVFAELLALRGADELWDVAAVLDALLAEDPAEARRLTGELPETWRDPLAAVLGAD